VYVEGAGDDANDWRLFAIDGTTGAVLSSPPLPPYSYDTATGASHGFNFGGGLHVVRKR
jgi:hypothetical protein